MRMPEVGIGDTVLQPGAELVHADGLEHRGRWGILAICVPQGQGDLTAGVELGLLQ